MQKFLLLCFSLCLSAGMIAQPIYIDQFDDGMVQQESNANWTITEEDGELLVTGNGVSGAFDGIYFDLGGQFDLSANPKVYIRAKTSDIGTSVRLDLVDGPGLFSDVEPVIRTLTSDYVEYEFDFSTVNVANNADGPLDLTTIKALFLYVDPGLGSFGGQLALDYISIGEGVDGPIVSDIYQDLMDSDSSVANFGFASDGYSVSREENSTFVTISGDGTSAQWTVLAYQLRPAPQYIETTVDITDNPKVFIKMRTNTPGTTVRFDIQDVDNFSSIGQSITRELTDEFVVYEFDYEQAFQIAIEGTACTEDNAPCPLNKEAIKEFIIYPNPGSTAFAAEIDIEFISFGVNLDGEGPQAPLLYSDHFDNERVDFLGPVDGFEVTETGTSMNIAGNGTSGEFGTISYTFNDPSDDQDTARVPVLVNFVEGNSKLFIRARTDGLPQRVRIDLIDTMGRLTDFAGVTQTFTDEWQVYTFDYAAKYSFADYGNGTDECSPEMRCPVDGTAIRDLLFFVRPGVGGFEGNIEIDWLSVGQPLEEGTATAVGETNYNDQFENADGIFTGNPANASYTADDGVLAITGNGSDAPFQQIRYSLRGEDGGAGKGNLLGSNNLLYVRARMLDNADGTPLRIDLVDEGGFETSNVSKTQTISGDDFMSYVYDFTGNYASADGGFNSAGPCPAQTSCDVDGERITQLVFYASPNPTDGAFNGTIEIDYISFGMDLSVAVRDFAELNTLQVFPNPAQDQLGVQYDLVSNSDVTISLFDGLGRRKLIQNLGQRIAGTNFESLNISDLAVGTYHMQILVNGLPTRAVTVIKR